MPPRDSPRGAVSGDQAVLDRHRTASGAEIGEESSPAQACGCVPTQAVDALDAILEPSLQTFAALSLRQEKDAEKDLAENDGIDSDLSLVLSQPPQNPRIRVGPGGLAEDVRVDQQGQSVSVDSDSMATKKPFSGEARSQSIRP